MIARRAGLAASSRYKWYVVGMLWCISLFNYADRQAIFSVFPLLEQEMNLSTVQLGLLGSAFAWVYGLCAPFAGIIVDRVSRTKAILFGLHAWSAICIATGASRTFTHLFAFRAAEGLGETFYFPASMSMISDYHGKRTRSRAMGLHQTSVYVGTVAGGFFAGLIGQHYGWRWSFYLFGGLGILLGFVLHRFLIEPVRGVADTEDIGETREASVPPHAGASGGVSYGEFLRDLFTTPTAILLMLAFICMNFVAVVLLSWMPKFLYDRFSLSLAAAGLIATLFAQAASMAGSPLGGWLADSLRVRAAGGRIYVQAVAALCAVPFVFLCGAASELTLAILALAFWGLFKGFYDANIWASLFDVVRPEARGRAVGLMNMVGWLGGGTAPLIIGYLAQTRGLGGAISSAAYVYIAGAVLLVIAAKVFAPRDVARIRV
ncbi:MAG: MFS transporter [Bryobacteraceae bacterium]